MQIILIFRDYFYYSLKWDKLTDQKKKKNDINLHSLFAKTIKTRRNLRSKVNVGVRRTLPHANYAWNYSEYCFIFSFKYWRSEAYLQSQSHFLPVIHKIYKSYYEKRADRTTNQIRVHCLINMVIDKHQPSPASGHSCQKNYLWE